jgi:hypothetical protein
MGDAVASHWNAGFIRQHPAGQVSAGCTGRSRPGIQASPGRRFGLCWASGCMTRYFKRNIGYGSRLGRGVMGTLVLIAGIVMADFELWLCLVLVALGLLALFEAVRGWCPARACGLRAKR